MSGTVENFVIIFIRTSCVTSSVAGHRQGGIEYPGLMTENQGFQGACVASQGILNINDILVFIDFIPKGVMHDLPRSCASIFISYSGKTSICDRENLNGRKYDMMHTILKKS